MQSDEKYNFVSSAQSLCGIALKEKHGLEIGLLMILNIFFRKILVLVIFINEYMHSYTDIVIDIYPSSFYSPPSYDRYNFIIDANEELTVKHANNTDSINLKKDDINKIITILDEIVENRNTLKHEVIMDSWDMAIYYHHREIKLNCWHDIYSKKLIDILIDISPIYVNLNGFS